MTRRRIHILYEHGPDAGPFGSAYIRLLRPLMHPSLSQHLEVTCGPSYAGQPVDAVIVDRLWRPDISPSLARELLDNVRRAGARLVYALDDDLLALSRERRQDGVCSPEEQQWVVRHLLQNADGVLVTTPTLQRRFSELTPNIAVVPQALDERLVVGRGHRGGLSPFGSRQVVIGCMGTFTHDDDLMMVLPALRSVSERHPGAVEFQVIGVAGRDETLAALRGLPVRFLTPAPEERAYPLFMLWFSSRVHWDIALAPLRDTPFNRCKSDIKFLDYSAIGAAGIYSRVGEYGATVRHAETGLLVGEDVQDWVQALESLVRDADLRARISENAAAYLFGRRTIANSADKWLAALEELLENV